VEPEFFAVFNFTAAQDVYITAMISHILLLILSALNAPNDKSRTLLKQHYKGYLEWHLKTPSQQGERKG